MPVRRSRAEQLVLVPGDGKPPVTLFTEDRDPGELTTQDVFQASADGAFLAYAARGELHVRAADGSERTIGDYERTGEMRFSPDGKLLAAVTGPAYGEHGQRLVVLDLAAGTTRELASFKAVSQLEWMPGALVVQAWDATRNQQMLVEQPLAGTSRLLVEPTHGELDRFVAAATGTRIVAFIRDRDREATRVVSFETSRPAVMHELGVVHDPITNAAASLDGQRIAFTTALAVFTTTGEAKPEAISSRDHIHSLWFAHDGRLGYASLTSATVLDGSHVRRFDGDGAIHMLRFDPTSSRALVAAEHGWDIAADRSERVADAPASGELLGVDHFAGGMVVWATRR